MTGVWSCTRVSRAEKELESREKNKHKKLFTFALQLCTHARKARGREEAAPGAERKGSSDDLDLRQVAASLQS